MVVVVVVASWCGCACGSNSTGCSCCVGGIVVVSLVIAVIYGCGYHYYLSCIYSRASQ